MQRTNRVVRLLCALTFVALGLLLLDDGTSTVLIARDPDHPRRKIGCYTALEIAVGVNEPSALRLVEDLVGLALVCYAPLAGRKLSLLRGHRTTR